jgi:hypothetical protein
MVKRFTVNCAQFFVREDDMTHFLRLHNLSKGIVDWGAGVAQSVQYLATGWTTGRSKFDPRQGQRVFPVASVSRPALGPPPQPPVQWVPGVKRGRGVTLTTHPIYCRGHE